MNSASDILYVDKVLDKNLKGWLPVRKKNCDMFHIPHSTKLECIEDEKYQILEGIHKFEIVEIDYKSINPRFQLDYLSKIMQYRKKVKLTLMLDAQELVFKSDIRINIKVFAANIEKGEYKILLPDRPHIEKAKKEYFDESIYGSRFASTWFPIMKNYHRGQYLHLGLFSEGCVTVLVNQNNNWGNLYKYLLTSREADGVLGYLSVI